METIEEGIVRRLRSIAIRLHMLFGRRGAQRELDMELREHLDRQVAENRAAGMSPDESSAAALRLFGNPALLRDQARSAWNWNAIELLIRDFAYAVRTLRRTPGFALIAIVVMGLGIGANVALFTVVRGVLLKPLPFKDPDRLMMLYEDNQKGDAFNIVSGGMYSEWRKHNQSFSNLALVQDSPYSLSGSRGQLPEKLTGAKVSWDLLTTLGVSPAYGRDFTSADDSLSANGTILLSWSLWKRRFGTDPGILNRTIYVDAKPYTVIGIMPQWFAFPEPDTQIWTPVYHEMPASLMAMINNHMFRVVGRLKPGVTPTQGMADLSVLSKRVHDDHLDLAFVSPAANIRPLLDHMVGDVKRPLYVLLAATGCLLLIACLNVANLLVARAAARRRELAIRTALGGGWLRLLRERLLESLLLSGAGGALGVSLAYAALLWLAHTRRDMTRIEAIHIDATVALFTICVIFFCALFAGMINALSSSDRQVLSALQESSRGQRGSKARSGLRRTLLTLEVGLTVVLLTGAGLLLKSYERLRSADMGCATQNVLTMRIGLSGARYKTPGPAPANFFRAMLERVRALPGVDAAGMVTAVPGQGWWEDSGFVIVEHSPLTRGQTNDALSRWADSGYFTAMGIPMVRGRTFNDSLRLDQAREIVISDGLARNFFPGEDPLGKHLRTNDKTYTIVGIVGDFRYQIGEQPMETKYFSLNEGGENYGTLVIRSSHDVEQLAVPIQRVIQDMDHDLPVADVLTMDQLLGKSMLDQSFNTTLLVGFAALSLLLAAVGLFGVLSYIVAQRTGEIGIRMALGAPRVHVMRRMLLDGLSPAIVGLVLGLIASVEASRLLTDMLYETRSLDLTVFAAVALTLLLVAAFACLLPAWRASRIDPMQALRTE
jgi:putative ABC transport system permease protein